MSVENLTIGELQKLLGCLQSAAGPSSTAHPMLGKYVIVRCRDAGVHAGVLLSASDRTAHLSESRRLWYWKPANGAAFLSGVAVAGLHSDSKVGAPIEVVLTENCEIILCSKEAEASIRAQKNYEV